MPKEHKKNCARGNCIYANSLINCNHICDCSEQPEVKEMVSSCCKSRYEFARDNDKNGYWQCQNCLKECDTIPKPEVKAGEEWLPVMPESFRERAKGSEFIEGKDFIINKKLPSSPSLESWEGDFDNDIGTIILEDAKCGDLEYSELAFYIKIKSFIKNLLSSEKAKIVEQEKAKYRLEREFDKDMIAKAKEQWKISLLEKWKPVRNGAIPTEIGMAVCVADVDNLFIENS